MTRGEPGGRLIGRRSGVGTTSIDPAELAPSLGMAYPARCDRSRSTSLALRLSSGDGKRTQRGSMLETGQNRTKRIVCKGRLVLRPLALASLGALVFVGSAVAAPVAGPNLEIHLPTPTLEAAPEIALPTPTPEPTPPPTPAPEATPPPTPVPEASAPPRPAPEASTPPIPAPEASPPPTPVPVATPPPTPAPEASPPPTPAREPPETPTTTRKPEATAEPPHSTPTPEADAKSSPTPSLGSPQGPGGGSPPVLPSAPIGSLPTAFALGGGGAAGPSSLGASAKVIAALGVAGLSCALSGFERRISGNCAGGSASAQRLNATTLVPVGSANGAPSLAAATAGTPSDTDPGGSAVGSRPPTSPAPSPVPGGASGGSAPGGSGLALSAFLTLAALLRLAPSRAMRRLRLLCEPRLTACFVLIPERPG
jgi:hypothetical protein